MNTSASHALAGLHVLVVEDHDDSREMWERALRYAGALVVASDSARGAIEYCFAIRFDVSVTDLSMPGEDGVWPAQQFRARGQRVPIIAVSGSEPEFVDRLPRALFTRVLQKPVDPWRLVEAIAAAVQ